MIPASNTPIIPLVGYWAWWQDGCLIQVTARSWLTCVWEKPSTAGAR